MDISLLYGRRELVPKVDLPPKLPTMVQVLPTLAVTTSVRCLRCNAMTARDEGALPHGQYYCSQCISLGRVSTLDSFYHVPEPNQFSPPTEPLTWRGQLSPLQSRVAEEVRRAMAKHQQHLLWAVTGAGKTEMMFSTIEQALKKRERVCIASPRVDVCLELFPRLQRAFQKIPMILLHGQQEQPYRYCQLTVCTTHQLLRFYHAFDLLIVDEVDSFPYAANQQLLFATNQAKKPAGGLLMMTATPGKILLREVKRHRLTVSYLPLRYHGHLLPEIKRVKISSKWRCRLAHGRLPLTVIRWVNHHMQTKKRFLMFVPHVADLTPVADALKKIIPEAAFTTVYAADDERLAKVQKMREGQYQFLITTTILERGVTFPAIDVCVIGADDEVFSSSALVQIAGRVGRSADYPDGQITFFIGGNTLIVSSAVRQIKFLNRLGRRLQWRNV
ncbi:helicase domain-containing protein [Limosilactobacillus coleohominis DSM 14060]|nr:helicase domain-containing protein [Limosilactobacillus coleohominis DSM 14060]